MLQHSLEDQLEQSNSLEKAVTDKAKCTTALEPEKADYLEADKDDSLGSISGCEQKQLLPCRRLTEASVKAFAKS